MSDTPTTDQPDSAPSADDPLVEGLNKPVMHEDDKSTVSAAPPPSSGSVETTPSDSVPAGESWADKAPTPTFEQALVAENILEGEDGGQDKVQEVRSATYEEGEDPDIDTGGALGYNVYDDHDAEDK